MNRRDIVMAYSGSDRAGPSPGLRRGGRHRSPAVAVPAEVRDRARPVSRLAARAIDVAIVGVPAVVLCLPFLVAFGSWVGTSVAAAPANPFADWPFGLFIATVCLLGPLAWAGYTGWYGGVRGATIGQRTIGLRVVRDDSGRDAADDEGNDDEGNDDAGDDEENDDAGASGDDVAKGARADAGDHPTGGAAGGPLGFGRYVAREAIFAASAVVFFGFVSIFVDPEGELRGWHDRAVGSRVVTG